MRFTAADVAAATGGRWVAPACGAVPGTPAAVGDVELVGASFDTRSLLPGQLFVPIVAERDGHDFVGAAVAAGARAYLTSDGVRPDGDGAVAIEVADTATALMDLAGWGVRRLDATVVGITGSVGKTSTKDLAAAAIAVGRRVTANARSFNNEQGLPVTVLGAPDDTEILVLEMGMRGFGEIARLCAVAQPRVGIVIAVAPSHTERVGGIEGVARAKAELMAALPSDGVAILNYDDRRVRAMAASTDADVVFFGESAQADVRMESIVLDELARASFTVRTPWGSAPVTLAVSGRHMVTNAAAAMAAAGHLGVSVASAAEAMGRALLSPSRMAGHRLASGALVIDDAYNANPASMRAALDTLAAVPAARRIAVLGEMAELDDPPGDHAAVAAHVAALGIELIAVGTPLYGVAPATDYAVAIERIGRLDAGTAVLVKASRVAQLDRLAARLVDPAG